jgi:protein SCO1
MHPKFVGEDTSRSGSFEMPSVLEFRKGIPILFVLVVIVLCLEGLHSQVAQAQSVGGLTDSSGIPTERGKLPAILQSVGINQRLGTQIPLDATFTDENGKTVSLRSYFGKRPVVLILAYYRCPMLCSEVLSGATAAFKTAGFQIGDQFNVLTVSIDPRETPDLAASTKQRYIQDYGDPRAASGWHFLTGQRAQIDALATAVGFHYSYDQKTGQYAHAAGLVVITPEGKVAQYFYGVEFSDRDLRLALVQSSAGKIGSLVDEVLLFCCQYDPGTGRYQAMLARILQFAGAFTILVVGGGVLVFLRMDRRNRVLRP